MARLPPAMSRNPKGAYKTVDKSVDDRCCRNGRAPIITIAAPEICGGKARPPFRHNKPQTGTRKWGQIIARYCAAVGATDRPMRMIGLFHMSPRHGRTSVHLTGLDIIKTNKQLTADIRSMRVINPPALLLILVSCTQLLACGTAPVASCDAACLVEQRRSQYIEQHPQLSEQLKAAIRSGKLMVGMSKEDVAAVLGPPDKTVDMRAKWIEREQWLYSSRGETAGSYVFRFGKLHSWTLGNNG